MKNYFIIHGSYTNNQGNWFPWLEKMLNADGKVTFNLNYPTSENISEAVGLQTYENWCKVLDTIKNELNEDTVFIGHSISCIFIIKYCLENKIKINKAIFVSGFNNYCENFTNFVKSTGISNLFYETLKTFYVDNISKFKKLCNNIVCVYSDNDPIITQERLIDFSEKLDAKTYCVSGAGHFCDGIYLKEFPEMLNILNNQSTQNYNI